MRGKVKVRTDTSREFKDGTTIKDGLDSYTVERTTKVRRHWLARLFGIGRKAKGEIPAIREDRVTKR